MPRIYVASLADYNCGRLHGVWIELDESSNYYEVIDRINAMLEDSPSVAVGETYAAEDFAIHDYDGFQGYELDESASIGTALEVAQLIEKHGEEFAKWLSTGFAGGDLETAASQFTDALCGVWTSAEDWAWEDFREMEPHAAELVDRGIRGLRFDPDAYLKDCQSEGMLFEKLSGGQVVIFDPNRI